MPSPPKPWETRRSSLPGRRNSTNRGFSNSSFPTTNLPSQPTPGASYSEQPGLGDNSNKPPLPSSAPDNNTNSMNRNYMGSGYGTNTGYNSGYGTGGYGTSYGGGYGSSYGGGYGSSYGTGYGSAYGGGYGGMGYGSSFGTGGYGGMMGGYGGGYGGYNRMGPHSLYGGMGPGLPMRPGMPEEPSLAAQMAQSTQSTFQVLERVVGTFGGVAQMLESTFFATQSSFMAMVGVAEQFGMLRHMFTQFFSFFTIFRWVRNFVYRIMGKRPPVDPKEINAKDFHNFTEKTKYSLRPFLMFLSLVFGVPYLLHLFMRSVARRLAQQKAANGQLPNSDGTQVFEFAQALYDFQGQSPAELSFIKGDLIAVLSKGPEAPVAGPPAPQWWQGRLRDGRVGMFPNNYVEILEKKVEIPDPTPNPNSDAASTTPRPQRLAKEFSKHSDSQLSTDTCYVTSPTNLHTS